MPYQLKNKRVNARLQVREAGGYLDPSLLAVGPFYQVNGISVAIERRTRMLNRWVLFGRKGACQIFNILRDGMNATMYESQEWASGRTNLFLLTRTGRPHAPTPFFLARSALLQKRDGCYHTRIL